MSNQHDKGYKAVLSKKRNFKAFLSQFVDMDWVKMINEDDLVLCDKGFVDPFFDELESDLIYRAKLAGTEVYFYVLLELQSSVDHTMPFRMFYYVAAIMRRAFIDAMKNERERAGFKLPIVVPIVFYNGNESWTAKGNFAEYQQGSEYFENFVDFRYILIDANKLSPKVLFENLNAISAIIAADKERESSNYEQFLNTLTQLLRARVWESDPEGYEDFFFWAVNALKRLALSDEDASKILEALKKGDANMETYATDYFRDQWVSDGVIQAALRLLSKGYNFNDVIVDLELSPEQIVRLERESGLQPA